MGTAQLRAPRQENLRHVWGLGEVRPLQDLARGGPSLGNVTKKRSRETGRRPGAAGSQFTEEKFGQAEKTELDAQFENLLARADSTKNWTEKILRQTEVLLQPNPSARVEEFLYEKLDRKVPSRVTNGELLAQYMAEAASELGPTTPYGKTLIKVAEAEKRLGAAERDFIHMASIGFLTPLRTFLEGDWKTISKERRLLHNRRLDLDACKARLKKAKAAEAKATCEGDVSIPIPRAVLLLVCPSRPWSAGDVLGAFCKQLVSPLEALPCVASASGGRQALEPTVPDFQETRPRNYILSASASATLDDTSRPPSWAEWKEEYPGGWRRPCFFLVPLNPSVTRARGCLSLPKDRKLWNDEVDKAEQELRVAQTEFDRQAEVTRLLLEGISSTHVNHLRCLHEFVESQTTYYAQCYRHMLDLQKQLGRFPGTFVGTTEPASPPLSSTSPTTAAATMPGGPSVASLAPPGEAALHLEEVAPPASGTRKARVLYDYEAADSSELALLADELITVYSLPGMDPDWLIGERGNKKGKVPVTYLELLS
ncbi:endophilin-B2 isoform X2 [Globicephala melas]|uniref:endophilin-B2 isoform X2 n=1 Tax=Globicephala melas TaxID=9731 RepID=UPI00293D22BA|nr:endophilin-B2 isoform X2 [Globicephala melas]